MYKPKSKRIRAELRLPELWGGAAPARGPLARAVGVQSGRVRAGWPPLRVTLVDREADGRLPVPPGAPRLHQQQHGQRGTAEATGSGGSQSCCSFLCGQEPTLSGWERVRGAARETRQWERTRGLLAGCKLFRDTLPTTMLFFKAGMTARTKGGCVTVLKRVHPNAMGSRTRAPLLPTLTLPCRSTGGSQKGPSPFLLLIDPGVGPQAKPSH